MAGFFQELELDVQTEITNLERFVEVDVWPYVKEFFAALFSQAGNAALKAAVANIPEALVGNDSVALAAVAAAVASSLAANAAADAQKALSDAEANLAAQNTAAPAETPAPEAPAPVETAEPTPGPSGDA